MINNNTDDFGCLQNSLFIVSCPHYFENIPKLRTNLLSAGGCFKELTMSYYYSKNYMYYVTTYLDKIAQNPEKMYISKIIFAFCCWLQVTQDHSWRKPSTWQCPHKHALLRGLLCVFPCEPIALLCHQADVSAVTFRVALSNGIS